MYIWCDGEQAAMMEGHSKPITDVKWVNDVTFLSASQDQAVFLWKVILNIADNNIIHYILFISG